ELIPHLDPVDSALAGATAVGHVLECSGQITGGNFEPPGGGGFDAADYARLGFPLARVMADGSAEIGLLPGAAGRVDPMTCTLQLLYEVHDPRAYLTPDVTIDFTGISFEPVGPNRVRMSGARAAGRPAKLKVSGFVDRPGFIADVEIAFAGSHALDRARRAAEALRLRLSNWRDEDIVVDLVGVDSVLGKASAPLIAPPPELRVHVSARCPDAEAAQIVEDEVYALTLSGPAGGGAVRSERRPRLEVLTGFIARDLVKTSLDWTVAG
ncbi:MAG TPA: acyclic terpene utilization AtuA family protein, partial [Stellaceae bacterium]|nr:acyclic terpene utilization AtuA family protein [Stellaceae bacterium]